MPNPTTEKEVCECCGVEARENTQFCYNCGTPKVNTEIVHEVAQTEHDPHGDPVGEDQSIPSNGTPDPEAKLALDELSDKLKPDQPGKEEKLGQAAEQRRKARVVRRQPKRYTWEPADDLSAVRLVIVSILVAVVAGVMVLITVFWR
jgi:hypothetical protein